MRDRGAPAAVAQVLENLQRRGMVQRLSGVALALLRQLPLGGRAGRLRAGLERRAGRTQVFGKGQGTRVLMIVSHELAPSGAPKLACQVAKICLADGWQVIVVSPSDGPYRETLVAAGAVVVTTPMALHDRSPIFTLAEGVDVVLCNTIITANLLIRRPGRRRICYVHETATIGWMAEQGRNLRLALKQADQIWAASPLVSRCLQPHADAVVVIGGAVDSVPANPIREEQPKRLLVLGSIEPRKGQLPLAHAYAALSPEKRRAITVTVHGREYDKTYAATLRLATAGLTGWENAEVLSPEAARAALADADGVIIPSLDEPLSLVALEAMSAGKLVLCTRACGVADFLEDGISAFLADAPTAAGIGDMLARALANPARWAAIGGKGRAVYDAEFHPDVFAAKVRQHLRNLID